MVLLFELPLCREALGKILGFAMWSLGAVAGAVGANSGDARRSLAGEGWGRSLWATRVLFGHLVGGERRPVGGAPAASGGGRGGLCSGEARAR
jgi:hypothetical protein